MKATFALLVDRDIANTVSQWAWRLHVQYGIGVGVRRLPPHVSLKQPFEAEDLDALEAFFDSFAESVAPLALTVKEWQLWETPGEPAPGVLSIGVAETSGLVLLHKRLNRELTERFGEREAEFDGAAYHFHLTVAAGNAPVAAYRQAFAACQSSVSVARTVAVREIALFVYESDKVTGEWEYTTYKVLPLGENYY